MGGVGFVTLQNVNRRAVGFARSTQSSLHVVLANKEQANDAG
jgi:hypothetical protein